MMQVRPARAAPQGRSPLTRQSGDVSAALTYMAPKMGLVSVTDATSAEQGAASILRNFFPTLTGARIRGGSLKVALLAGLANVQSAFSYKYGSIQRAFMSTGAAIFDVTSPAAPPAMTAATVTGQTSGFYSTLQQTTTGGSYLCAFNGSDPRQIFDGTSWVTTPALTFADSTTSSQINYGFLFKGRQWLIKNGSLDAYYLPVNQIGGSAILFPLGGIMRRGGSLLTGFSWSIESGDGLSDLLVLISTEGEVVIYAGSDPAASDATAFALRGVYQIGKPLGKNAWIKAGADVFVATTDGLIPISQVLTRDKQSISLEAISRPVDDQWRRAAEAAPFNWTITQWSERNLVFITFPQTVVYPDTTFVLNSQTGRWATISNWRATCFVSTQGAIFFGSTAGNVFRGDITGSDDGLPFTACYLSHFQTVDAFGQRKIGSLASMTVRATIKPYLRLFARSDGNMTEPPPPLASMGDSSSSAWDLALWDQAKWDGLSAQQTFRFRQNVRATGNSMALGCTMFSAGQFSLDVELDASLLQMETGQTIA